jgi:hypothetical protein
MKKLVLVTVVLSVALSLLTSCAGLFGGDNGNQTPNPLDNGKQYKRIVYSSSDLNLTEVRTKIMDILGPMGGILDTDEAEIDGEIVFGSSSRKITADAKALLEADIAKSSKYDCGYIVYASENNIAVYWQYDDMADLAINTFISECLDKAKLKLTDGIVAIKLYDRRDFEMNGRSLKMAVDTGAPLSYVDNFVTDRLEPCGEKEDFHPIAGRYVTKVYELEGTVGGKPFNGLYGNLPMKLGLPLNMFGINGVIGYDFFKSFRVMLDFRSGRAIIAQ